MKTTTTKMLNKTWPGLALGMTLGLAAPSSEAAIIISNNFDGGSTIGPAFKKVDNGQGGGGSAGADTGVISTAANQLSAVGLNNVTSVNVTTALPAATGFTIDWVVSSAAITGTTATNAAGSPRANGWYFGVTDSTASDGTGLFNNAPNAFGVTLVTGSYQNMGLFERTGGTMVATSLGVAMPTVASFNDGFTVSLTFHSDQTWFLTTTGLSENINSSGTATHASYGALASNLVASTSVQGNAITYTVDSVTVTAIPEPSSLVLVSGALLGLVARRRRSR